MAESFPWRTQRECVAHKSCFNGNLILTILVIRGLTRAKLLIMRESSTRNEANPLTITGSEHARPSGRGRIELGLAKAGASAFAAEKNRFRTGLTLVFVHLLSEG